MSAVMQPQGPPCCQQANLHVDMALTHVVRRSWSHTLRCRHVVVDFVTGVTSLCSTPPPGRVSHSSVSLSAADSRRHEIEAIVHHVRGGPRFIICLPLAFLTIDRYHNPDRD